MKLLLLILASLIKIIIAPFAWVYGIIGAAKDGELSKWWLDLAIAKDQYGNGLCKYLFNHILITDDGYKFGDVDETISSVIGKNRRKGTLTKTGKWVDGILDTLQPNHSIMSIDNSEDSAVKTH